MKETIEAIIEDIIEDFNIKWQSEEEKDEGISNYAENIITVTGADYKKDNEIHDLRCMIDSLENKIKDIKNNSYDEDDLKHVFECFDGNDSFESQLIEFNAPI